MTGNLIPTCPGCGKDLVLEMDPGSPPDAQASVLLADPPIRRSAVPLRLRALGLFPTSDEPASQLTSAVR